PHCTARDAECGCYGREVVPHQRHVARFDGHVRSGADGDADVCLCECGRVIDTVADHCYDVALVLEVANGLCLAFGPDAGTYLVDAYVGCDSAGGFFRVTRDHGDADTEVVQGFDGGLRRGAYGVCDGEHTGRLAIHRGPHKGLSPTGKVVL